MPNFPSSRLVFWPWLVLLLLSITAIACDDLPAVTINPNAIDGDAEGSGDDDAEGDDPADGDIPDGDPDGDSPYVEALPLYEDLEDGEVRAGEIGAFDSEKTEDELPGGKEAAGRAGDFKLYNSRAAFIISAAGMGREFNVSGGTIIDAVSIDESGNESPDLLSEAFPTAAVVPQFIPIDGTVRLFSADSVQLIANGEDGQPARVRATGIDVPMTLMDQLIEASDPQPLVPLNPLVTISIDYILEADADYLRIETTVSLEEQADDLNPESVRPGLGMLVNDEMNRFYPKMPFDGVPDPNAPQVLNAGIEPDYFAFDSPETAYALTDAEGRGVFSLFTPIDPRLIMLRQDMLFLEDTPQTESMLFFVNGGGVDGLYDSILRYRSEEGVARESESMLSTVNGSVSLSAFFGDSPVEVFASSVAIPDDVEEPGDQGKPEMIWASTQLHGTNVFSLTLPAGDWNIYARNVVGELTEAITIQLEAATSMEDVALPALSIPANVTVSVEEKFAEGNAPLAARVDFYQGSWDFSSTANIPNEAFRMATVFTNASTGVATVLLPMEGQTEARFTYLISHGPQYSYATGVETYTANLSTGESQGPQGILLERLVENTFETEGRDVGEEPPADPVSVRIVAADLNVHSERSLLSRVSRVDRLANAAAENFEYFCATDHDTVADYSFAEQVSGVGISNHLVWSSGIQVSAFWSHFSGISVLQPEDRAPYYGIDFFSYLEDGTYNGFLPAYTITETIASEYNAKLIQIDQPRGEKKAASFFDHYKYNPHEGYEGSFPYEAKEAIGNTHALEIINGRVDFIYTYQSMQDWFSLINQGIFLTATGNSAVHNLVDFTGYRMGAVRNLVYLTDDSPADPAVAVEEALLAGHSVVSTGPTVSVSIYDKLPGDTLKLYPANPGERLFMPLKLKVQAPKWMPVHQVALCINGERMDDYSLPLLNPREGSTVMDTVFEFVVPREGGDSVPDPLVDSWISVIVTTRPNQTSDPIYSNHPFAVSNPIFLDVDGEEGFSPLPLREAGDPYCLSSRLCELFTHYDGGRQIALAEEACCREEYSIAYWYNDLCGSSSDR